MKIHPVGAKLFHRTGSQTDRYDETNSRFSQLYERVQMYIACTFPFMVFPL